jgi:hypothetical protein
LKIEGEEYEKLKKKRDEEVKKALEGIKKEPETRRIDQEV